VCLRHGICVCMCVCVVYVCVCCVCVCVCLFVCSYVCVCLFACVWGGGGKGADYRSSALIYTNTEPLRLELMTSCVLHEYEGKVNNA
jgi:hypothetical protein